MSKKRRETKDGLPVIDAREVTIDPLHTTIGPQHLVAVLQQRYPQVYDACMGFAAASAQEAKAREVVAERDKEIADLRAKLEGKAAVKEAEKVVSPNGTAG